MSDFQLHALMRGVLVPAVVTGAVYILSRLTPLIVRDALRGVGLAVAVLMAYVLLLGLPTWPLTGSPAGVAGALVLVALWLPLSSLSVRRLWLKRFLFMSAIALICLRPLIEHAWNWPQILSVLVSVAGLSTAAWAIIERGSRQMNPAAALTNLLILSGTLAAYIGLTASASLAQLAGALTAGLAAAAALSLIPTLRPGTEFTETVAAALTALLCAHVFYVETNFWQLLWLAMPLGWFMVRDLIDWKGATPLKDALATAFISAPVGLWFLWQLYQSQSSSAQPY